VGALVHWPRVLGGHPHAEHPAVAAAARGAYPPTRARPKAAPLPPKRRGVGSAAFAAEALAAEAAALAAAPRPALVFGDAMRGGVATDAPASALDVFPTFLAAALGSAAPEQARAAAAGVHVATHAEAEAVVYALALQADGVDLLPLFRAAARYRAKHAAAHLADVAAAAAAAAAAAVNASRTSSVQEIDAAAAAAPLANASSSPPPLSPRLMREAALAGALLGRALLVEAPRPPNARRLPDGGVKPNFVAMRLGRYEVLVVFLLIFLFWAAPSIFSARG
jgi:hypothetical protein